jgi:hypothetical protein
MLMTPISEEKQFSVQQIAESWNLSENAVRGLFRDGPGVVRFMQPARRGTRHYVTLRIPQSVMDRVHRRMVKPG